jgi:hypothetical protein
MLLGNFTHQNLVGHCRVSHLGSALVVVVDQLQFSISFFLSFFQVFSPNFLSWRSSCGYFTAIKLNNNQMILETKEIPIRTFSFFCPVAG